MENELEQLLTSLGLEHQESKVYLQALTLGTSPASIIAKRCDLPRSTARYTCEQLVAKQLMIESQKGNTKLFTPENPEKLKKLLDLQQERLELRSQKLDSKLQDLKRLYNPYTVIPKMRFYEGVQGIIELVEDVFTEAVPIFGALSMTEEMHPDIAAYVKETYVPKRRQTGQEAWMLFNDNKQTREYQKEDKTMNRVSLLVPYKDFPFDSCCHIYGNKVAFYSYNKNDMTGVIVENAIIHNTQLSIFRLAWEQAKARKENGQYINTKLPL